MGHNMTEEQEHNEGIDKLEKEINELIKKIRIKSIKKLLILWGSDLPYDKDKLKITTKEVREHLRDMFRTYSIPKMRVARDYKYALNALLLIGDLKDEKIRLIQNSPLYDELRRLRALKEKEEKGS